MDSEIRVRYALDGLTFLDHAPPACKFIVHCIHASMYPFVLSLLFQTVEAERISVDHVAHIKPSDGSSTATQRECDALFSLFPLLSSTFLSHLPPQLPCLAFLLPLLPCPLCYPCPPPLCLLIMTPSETNACMALHSQTVPVLLSVMVPHLECCIVRGCWLRSQLSPLLPSVCSLSLQWPLTSLACTRLSRC